MKEEIKVRDKTTVSFIYFKLVFSHSRNTKKPINSKSAVFVLPLTVRLLVASDDPRMFRAAHVYGPASL